MYLKSKTELIRFLEAFETDSAVVAGADGNLKEVRVKGQATFEANPLTEDSFVVILNDVDNGRSCLRSGRIEMMQAYRLL